MEQAPFNRELMPESGYVTFEDGPLMGDAKAAEELCGDSGLLPMLYIHHEASPLLIQDIGDGEIHIDGKVTVRAHLYQLETVAFDGRAWPVYRLVEPDKE